MPGKIESTHKLTCAPGDLTVGLLKEFLKPLSDPNVKVKVIANYPDRPGELGRVEMSAEVDIQSGRFY